MRKPSPGKILVGPAGWSYADWEGIVYPRSKPRGFHEAAYLAQYFDTIEINTSFYNPLRAEVAAVVGGEGSAQPFVSIHGQALEALHARAQRQPSG